MHSSLNFLSPEKKAVLRKGFVFAYVQTLLLLLFVAVAFCSGLLLTLRMMLNSTHDDIAKQTAGSDRDTTAVNQEIKKVNDYLKRQDSLVKGFGKWSTVVGELSTAMPKGVHLSLIRIDPGGKIELNGEARNRQDVLDLEKALKGSKTFKDVNSPLSNILEQYNVGFTFQLQLVNPPVQPTFEDPAKKKKRGT